MVERFNGRISDVLATRRYVSSEDLEQTLKRYCWLYNHHIPQKALHHKTPIATMKEWQEKSPDLFYKNVTNHAGPDNSMISYAGLISILNLFKNGIIHPNCSILNFSNIILTASLFI